MRPSDARPRILFVTPVSPFSSASGSEQRSALMLSALTQVGEVDVLQLSQGGQSRVVADCNGGHLFVTAVFAGSDRSLWRYRPKADLTGHIEHALNHSLAEYQLIVGRYVWPVCQLVVPKSVPILVDLDDFRFRFSPLLPLTLATVKQRVLKSVAHYLARQQLKRFSGFFGVAAQDQREMTSGDSLPGVFLPNVPYAACTVPSPLPINKSVLFVGSLWYGPNIDGINWLLHHVWPTVLAKEPAAKLTLVGAAPKNVLTHWSQQPGVNAVGFVEDVSVFYQQTRLVVVPLLAGGGTNIKVLEALGFGRPCVVTRFVANAFAEHLVADKEILVANDATEFAKEICNALLPNSQPRLQQMTQAGHTAIRASFTPASFKKCVADFAQALLNKTPRHGGSA